MMLPIVLLLLFLAANLLPTWASSAASTGSSIRTIIEYLDENGRQAVIDAADRASARTSSPGSGSGTGTGIVVDASQFNFLAADISENDIPILRNNPHIRSVEPEDGYPVFEAVPLDSTDLEDSEDGGQGGGDDHHHYQYRNLQEMIPEAVTIIQADQLSLGPNPPLVCIADSGYAVGHPDLPQPPMVNGTDMDMGDRILRWDKDFSGHGTESAGIIAAIEGNNVGLRGASPGVILHITRALDDDKRSTVSQMLRSIQQCVESGADIINLSLGCPCYEPEGSCRRTRCYSEDIERYFSHVAESGVMIFAAAGNQGDDVPFYPASYPSVVSVGAANRHLGKFGQSNRNNQVELMGLGYAVRVLGVKSDVTGEHSVEEVTSGTSVATSAVAASAALLFSHFPQCNGTGLRTAMGRTAINVGGCNNETGFGLVQVKDAYDLLITEGCELDGRLYFGGRSSCDAEFLQTYPPTTSPTTTPSATPTQYPTPVPTGDFPTDMPSENPVTETPTEQPTEEVTADTGGIIVDLQPTILPSPSPSPTVLSTDLSTEEASDYSTSNAPTRVLWPSAVLIVVHAVVYLY